MKKNILLNWVLLVSTSLFADDTVQHAEEDNKDQVILILTYARDIKNPETFFTVVQFVFSAPPEEYKLNKAWIELLDIEKREVYCRHDTVPEDKDGKVIIREFFPGFHSPVSPGFILEIEEKGTGKISRIPYGRPLTEEEKKTDFLIENKLVPKEDQAKQPPLPAFPEDRERLTLPDGTIPKFSTEEPPPRPRLRIPPKKG